MKVKKTAKIEVNFTVEEIIELLKDKAQEGRGIAIKKETPVIFYVENNNLKGASIEYKEEVLQGEETKC